MSEHTPTPYRTDGGVNILADVPGRKKPLRIATVSIAFLSTNEMDANRDFIIAACNAHDELVAACRTALNELVMAQENVINLAGADSEEAKAFDPALVTIRAALAAAKPN